jgi:hypothetical protein
MRTNPKPQDAAFDVHTWHSVMNAHARGPEIAALFEVQRRVVGTGLQQCESAIRQTSDILR